MDRRIVLVLGHPDAIGRQYGHALSAAHAWAAKRAGRELRWIELPAIDSRQFHSRAEWKRAPSLPAVRGARARSLSCLERNIARFCWIAPVRHNPIGLVENGDGRRERRLWRPRVYGPSAR